ncbi:aspartyl-phosphate phosphatase Spo0E family protein [Bacillus clarus]|uniref:Aspartyl-phosphate phosphatase Spo0E family protein n=2 Tax=Bacillus clarus TaxID=2338372 RepID=A0ABX9L143_9BACI|nr:aspartyl-phosphate phosphatase Spo0E family protein [Bacillus clarus]RFT68478.1 aspartyl-phosphate phosphatase Spo0E family protein [Bacillus clarus]
MGKVIFCIGREMRKLQGKVEKKEQKLIRFVATYGLVHDKSLLFELHSNVMINGFINE